MLRSFNCVLTMSAESRVDKCINGGVDKLVRVVQT